MGGSKSWCDWPWTACVLLSERRGGGWCVEKASCLVLHPGKHRVSLKATVHIHQSNLPHRGRMCRMGTELVNLWLLYPHISGDLLRVLLLFSSFSVGRKLLRWCNFFFFKALLPRKKTDNKSASMFHAPWLLSCIPHLLRVFLSCSVLVCTNIVSPPTSHISSGWNACSVSFGKAVYFRQPDKRL